MFHNASYLVLHTDILFAMLHVCSYTEANYGYGVALRAGEYINAHAASDGSRNIPDTR